MQQASQKLAQINITFKNMIFFQQIYKFKCNDEIIYIQLNTDRQVIKEYGDTPGPDTGIFERGRSLTPPFHTKDHPSKNLNDSTGLIYMLPVTMAQDHGPPGPKARKQWVRAN